MDKREVDFLTSMGYEIGISNGKLSLRYDIFPEATSKENYSVYLEIQEDLRSIGYELIDPYIEHDCVSGSIVKV